MTDSVSIQAHAKANAFLRILAREDTGYHSIETLFTLLDLCDTLRVERSDAGIDLTVDGADTGPTEDNLCYRAAREVLNATGQKFGVRILLQKQIPVKAGLGGGSSDAAATLHAVNTLANNAVPKHELLQFATRLGADVPFFTSGAPMALGWGRGDRLFRVQPPPEAPVLLAVPDFGVSTVDAYRAIDDAGGSTQRGSIVLEEDAFSSWSGIGRLGGNDFESVVFAREPRLRPLFESMAETRPLLVRLSGSGSAIVAIYKSDAELEDAATIMGTRHGRLLKTRTRATPAADCRLQITDQ